LGNIELSKDFLDKAILLDGIRDDSYNRILNMHRKSKLIESSMDISSTRKLLSEIIDFAFNTIRFNYIKSDALRRRANINFELKNYPLVNKDMNRNLALRKSLFDSRITNTIRSLNLLAKSKYNLNQQDESSHLFKTILQRVDQESSFNNDRIINFLSDYSLLLIYEGRLDSAKNIIDRIAPIRSSEITKVEFDKNNKQNNALAQAIYVRSIYYKSMFDRNAELKYLKLSYNDLTNCLNINRTQNKSFTINS